MLGVGLRVTLLLEMEAFYYYLFVQSTIETFMDWILVFSREGETLVRGIAKCTVTKIVFHSYSYSCKKNKVLTKAIRVYCLGKKFPIIF